MIDAAEPSRAIAQQTLVVMAWLFGGAAVLLLALRRRAILVRCLTLLALMLVVLAAAYAGPLAFAVLITVLVLAALGEFWRVCAAAGPTAYRPGGWIAGAGLVIAAHAWGVAAVAPAAAIAIFGLLCAAFFGPNRQHVIERAGVTLLGLGYVGLSGAFFVLLRDDSGFGAVVFTVAVTQLADVAAFFGGRTLGRHPVAPSLSPGKTLEGTVIGLAGGLAAATAFRFALPGLSLPAVIVAGALLSAVAFAGDLIASGFKREAGVKDFSRLLPEHGGILDRFDGVLAAAPVAWLLLQSGVLHYLD